MLKIIIYAIIHLGIQKVLNIIERVELFMKKIKILLLKSFCFSLAFNVMTTNIHAETEDYTSIIDEIVEKSGAPSYVIENSIEEVSTETGKDKITVANELLNDMKNEEISEETIELRASKKLPNSSLGDIWYSKATTSFYNHGHVGLYYSASSIIEARGAGYKVAKRNCSSITSKPGDVVMAVKSIKSKNTRASQRVRQSAVNWAETKLGKSYAYTVNNKSCGNNDYNCSQLVWCSYKKTTDGRDLDSDGTWFVSPSDIKNSDWTFNVWSY